MELSQPSAKLEEKSEKLSVLIVDDEKDICQVYSDLLKMHGFLVAMSSSPAEVLQSFKKGVYDLVILDVKMPSLNGHELYEKLHAIDNGIQVIFMTAYYFIDTKFPQRHQELGKANFMLKPLHIEQLLETINEMMHSKDSALET